MKQGCSNGTPGLEEQRGIIQTSHIRRNLLVPEATGGTQRVNEHINEALGYRENSR
jgi:hypothetical protein